MIYQDHRESSRYLQEKGIKPSYTRRRIWDFMSQTNSHPTVDQIYQELSHEIPTLSKTTVYNTLSLFLEKEMVKDIPGEDGVRYERKDHFHGHLQCSQCGAVVDVPVEVLPQPSHAGLVINDITVVFRGLCPQCASDA